MTENVPDEAWVPFFLNKVFKTAVLRILKEVNKGRYRQR